MSAGLLAGGVVACSGADVADPRIPTPADAYWTLALPSRAITMSTVAPYDTLQLTATAYSATGAVLTGLPAPTYTTSDSSVRVSATGLLTARAVRSGVQVIATLTYDGVRLADTAIINVTDAERPQIPARLVIQPQPGEDATFPIPTFGSFIYFPAGKTLEMEVEDAGGNNIADALVSAATSTPTTATFPTTAINPSGPVEIDFDQVASLPGPVTIYASATVYGVTVRDSMILTLKEPYLGIVEVDLDTVSATAGNVQTVITRNPAGDITISAGGVVWWLNTMTDSLDIVFDNPSAATEDFNFLDTGGGDIAPFPGCPGFLADCINVASRQFLSPGIVKYHSVRMGISGTIIIK
jgi:hypothetical protein